MSNGLISALERFAKEETCPVNHGCIHGFVSGANTGWGWARERVLEILKRNPPVNRSIPDDAVCYFRDGNRWCCVRGDFANLQESPAGFGETVEAAWEDLSRTMKL